MHHPTGEACASASLQWTTSAFVHAWGKGDMPDVGKEKGKDYTTYAMVLYTGDKSVTAPLGPDVSKHLALTHLALLGWLLLHVSSKQHPGSDVHHAQEQVTGR